MWRLGAERCEVIMCRSSGGISLSGDGIVVCVLVIVVMMIEGDFGKVRRGRLWKSTVGEQHNTLGDREKRRDNVDVICRE